LFIPSKQIRAGSVRIGGGAPVTVQSMLNAPAHDVGANVRQALALEKAGCEILRLSVPDKDTIPVVTALKEHVKIPIVADIHFDWRMAIESVHAGADKIRINPGNIGGQARVKAVADCCANAGVPVRVGVNAGSLEKDLLAKYGAPCAAALAESALGHARLLEQADFADIVLSVKSSHVPMAVQANRLLRESCDYPLHIGLTEAGTARMGKTKSFAAIGALLLDGIGDTVRVSLTADPLEEVRAALDLLHALDIRHDRPNIISCPTCGRTQIDLIGLAEKVEDALQNCKKPITVAVMGCAVNGPGEARQADIGLAGGKGEYLLFEKGEPIGKIPEEQALSALLERIDLL